MYCASGINIHTVIVLFVIFAIDTAFGETCSTNENGFTICHDDGLVIGVAIGVILGVVIIALGVVALTCYCCGFCCFKNFRNRRIKGEVLSVPTATPQYQLQEYSTGVAIIGTNNNYPPGSQLPASSPAASTIVTETQIHYESPTVHA